MQAHSQMRWKTASCCLLLPVPLSSERLCPQKGIQDTLQSHMCPLLRSQPFGAKLLRDRLKAAYETASSKGEGVSNELLKEARPLPHGKKQAAATQALQTGSVLRVMLPGCWLVAWVLRRQSTDLPSHSRVHRNKSKSNHCKNGIHLGSSCAVTSFFQLSSSAYRAECVCVCKFVGAG